MSDLDLLKQYLKIVEACETFEQYKKAKIAFLELLIVREQAREDTNDYLYHSHEELDPNV